MWDAELEASLHILSTNIQPSDHAVLISSILQHLRSQELSVFCYELVTVPYGPMSIEYYNRRTAEVSQG